MLPTTVIQIERDTPVDSRIVIQRHPKGRLMIFAQHDGVLHQYDLFLPDKKDRPARLEAAFVLLADVARTNPEIAIGICRQALPPGTLPQIKEVGE